MVKWSVLAVCLAVAGLCQSAVQAAEITVVGGMGYANGQPGEVQASTSLSTRSGVPDSKVLRDYSAEGRAVDVHGAGPRCNQGRRAHRRP